MGKKGGRNFGERNAWEKSCYLILLRNQKAESLEEWAKERSNLS